MADGQNKIAALNVEIPDSVDNAVKNLSDKPTKEMGTTLADLWYLVFGRWGYEADKKRLERSVSLELYERELREGQANIPAEHRKAPSLRIAGQALEKSKYVIEEERLRKMFVELITKASDKRYENLIHPSFSDIIEQMSTLDAMVFNYIYKQYGTVPVTAINPKIEIVEDQQYYINATPEWFLGWSIEGYTFFDISSSLISLSRLGVIELQYDRSNNHSDELLNQLKNSPFLRTILQEYQNAHSDEHLEIGARTSLCVINDFGQRFAKCCI